MLENWRALGILDLALCTVLGLDLLKYCKPLVDFAT